ncbi:11759_t:CDS:2, partial [Scutellospora calospora]
FYSSQEWEYERVLKSIRNDISVKIWYVPCNLGIACRGIGTVSALVGDVKARALVAWVNNGFLRVCVL